MEASEKHGRDAVREQSQICGFFHTALLFREFRALVLLSGLTVFNCIWQTWSPHRNPPQCLCYFTEMEGWGCLPKTGPNRKRTVTVNDKVSFFIFNLIFFFAHSTVFLFLMPIHVTCSHCQFDEVKVWRLQMLLGSFYVVCVWQFFWECFFFFFVWCRILLQISLWTHKRMYTSMLSSQRNQLTGPHSVWPTTFQYSTTVCHIVIFLCMWIDCPFTTLTRAHMGLWPLLATVWPR